MASSAADRSRAAGFTLIEAMVALVIVALGDDDEEIEFAGRLWQAHIEVSETPVENLRRVDVEIALADAPDRVIHKISGILEPPAPRGFLATRWLEAPSARFGAPGGRGRRGGQADGDDDNDRNDRNDVQIDDPDIDDREGFGNGAFNRDPPQ